MGKTATKTASIQCYSLDMVCIFWWNGNIETKHLMEEFFCVGYGLICYLSCLDSSYLSNICYHNKRKLWKYQTKVAINTLKCQKCTFTQYSLAKSLKLPTHLFKVCLCQKLSNFWANRLVGKSDCRSSVSALVCMQRLC